MRLSSLALTLSSAFGLVHGRPAARAAKPPQIFLIGDSTVAINGGWGNGFLSYIEEPAQGENIGVSGATTDSWKTNGRWDALLSDINTAKSDYEPIVTIQFGHNDQKNGDYDLFENNLRSIALDIKEAGGTPVRHSHP